MSRSYEMLLKDKEIIASEVLNEYNQLVEYFIIFIILLHN